MYIKDALGRDLSIVKFTAVGSTATSATKYFVHGTDRVALVTVSATTPLAKIQPDEATYFVYDHLGNTRVAFSVNGSNVPLIVNALDYYSYGKILRQYDNGDGDRYLTTGHERDKETGLDYRGARYYDSDVARFLSTDPWADKYPSWSTYNYVMGNPVMFTDPTGKGVTGDYYTTAGTWLGSDGKKDDKAYVADSKNEDGTFKNAEELSIGNTELLDRAAWVFGESRGSDEVITNRVVNAGEKGQTKNARVADYYAFAINNGAKKAGGFYIGLKDYMKKTVGGKVQYTGEGYFEGTGIGGNTNSKDFAKERKKGIESLMALTNANTAISAVISSVNGGVDPTNGTRVWLGSGDAKRYVENASKHTYGAGFQFSFSSQGGSFNHSFWRK
ncbi:RHS repeat-associated core domain-containing protein [Fluviicola sp.]|uniref:RHS repeat-associated core domain-containing protein n=1 Tax=Fluviicola sp. TaxID=1917219 RepID=UPI003D27BED3